MSQAADAGLPHRQGMTSSDQPVFRIALSMSGAISAGAYTAGVFDFLMQALAEYERSRDVDKDHRVRIVSLTGASAGGITAALGAVALGYGLPAKTDEGHPGGRDPAAGTVNGVPEFAMVQMSASNGGTIPCLFPSLFDAWVVKPAAVAAGSAGGGKSTPPRDLLSGEDLGSGKQASSLLNSTVLDGIREASLRPPRYQVTPQSYPFLADPFHVYLTLTNLRGIPYDLAGQTGNGYHMLDHSDRIHAVVFRSALAATGASPAPGRPRTPPIRGWWPGRCGQRQGRTQAGSRWATRRSPPPPSPSACPPARSRPKPAPTRNAADHGRTWAAPS